MPNTSKKPGETRPEFMTTLYYEFYREKPDYWVLFPFGSIGVFCRVLDGTQDQHMLNSRCILGIALGRSKYTNGVVFYNSELDSFCMSADYILDQHHMIGEIFPSIRYNGGLITAVISDKNKGPPRFAIGESVFMQCQETFNIILIKIKMIPTSN